MANSAQQLLQQIEAYCRDAGIAESTFGRLAVNDGKFVSRLRDGSRVTPETWQRVTEYIATNGGKVPSEIDPTTLHVLEQGVVDLKAQQTAVASEGDQSADRNFRFFDNRQKYLLFINTCNEKDKIGERVGLELNSLSPSPPAFRLFDAGIGDGTVLTRVLREMHCQFPTMPFYVSGKEVSLEDIRLTLDKLPDRLYEHQDHPTDADLAPLRTGLTLKDGPTRPARARLIDPPALWQRDPPVRVRKSIPDAWVEITITEGRNRQVRRMCAHVGFPCLRLVRWSVGQWTLDGIGQGKWVKL